MQESDERTSRQYVGCERKAWVEKWKLLFLNENFSKRHVNNNNYQVKGEESAKQTTLYEDIHLDDLEHTLTEKECSLHNHKIAHKTVDWDRQEIQNC